MNSYEPYINLNDPKYAQMCLYKRKGTWMSLFNDLNKPNWVQINLSKPNWTKLSSDERKGA